MPSPPKNKARNAIYKELETNLNLSPDSRTRLLEAVIKDEQEEKQRNHQRKMADRQEKNERIRQEHDLQIAQMRKINRNGYKASGEERQEQIPTAPSGEFQEEENGEEIHPDRDQAAWPS